MENNTATKTATTTLTIGKTYTQSWTFLGHARTARVTPESVCKNGSLRGTYVCADGKRYARTFVKPSEFANWGE